MHEINKTNIFNTVFSYSIEFGGTLLRPKNQIYLKLPASVTQSLKYFPNEDWSQD